MDWGFAVAEVCTFLKKEDPGEKVPVCIYDVKVAQEGKLRFYEADGTGETSRRPHLHKIDAVAHQFSKGAPRLVIPRADFSKEDISSSVRRHPMEPMTSSA